MHVQCNVESFVRHVSDILHILSHLILGTRTDVEEQLEIEAMRQQEDVSLEQENEVMYQQESEPVQTSTCRESTEDFPPLLPDSMNLPPPEWPDSPLEENIPSDAK